MTSDVYVPELKLAFEYHGEHHYQETSMSISLLSLLSLSPLPRSDIIRVAEEQQERDQQKRAALANHGIVIYTCQPQAYIFSRNLSN